MAKAKRKNLEILNDTGNKDDKRVFSRFAVDNLPVRFKDLKVGQRGSAVCRDISGSGAGIDCSQELKPRTPLEMWFDLPDGFEPMHLLGKVAWSRSLGDAWRLGVSFDKARFMSMARLLKVVE